MPEAFARTKDLNRRLLFLTLVLIVCAPIKCQTEPSPNREGTQIGDTVSKLPAFEVVSIRPNKSGRGFALNYTPDGFTATDMPLQPVIVNAYKLRDPELMIGQKLIPGAPSWITSDRYDIRAKMSDSDAAALKTLSTDRQIDQKRLMLQSMLADRFGLKVRRETKQAPCYALVIGKSGSGMKEAASRDPSMPDGKLLARPGLVTAQGSPMAKLIFALTGALNCPVQDRTDLTGKYDFTLRYSPDQGFGPMSMRAQRAQQDPAATSPDTGPSLFTAVREQLGLRLVRVKVPVEGIFIEHVERPTEN